jgi:hypothetical protein
MTRNDNIHRTNEFYRKEIIKMTKNCDNREFLKAIYVAVRNLFL